MSRASLAAFFTLAAASAEAQTTAFVDGRIIDGTGKVIERGTVLVTNGMIAEVGSAASVRVPAGAIRVELRGKTLMPGLVNAHGHLSAVNGFESGPQHYTRENLIRQLRAYANYGVTTVFSLGDDQGDAFKLRDEQASGAPDRARVFVAGAVITGGTAEAAGAATEKVLSMKPDLIKVRVDDNLGTASKMPEAAWRAALAKAQGAGLKLAAHIFYLSDAKAMAEAGTPFIAHSVRDQRVDAAFIAAMKKSGACYSPTLMREVSTFVYESTPTWANDPFFLRGHGAEIVAQITDAARQERFRATPAYAAGQKYKAALEIAKRNLKSVADAGIPIAFGTDSGPTGRFQGFFEHLELEMMVDAGLTPMQALVAATGDATKCWGKEGTFGAVSRGAAADFLVLTSNPLDSIRNTRTIEDVYIGGRALGPAGR
jgi:imidazolonepropionase-like amidohydrolase